MTMQTTNRLMILGGINAGKSTLTDALLGKDRKNKKIKTQSLVYDDWIVDTPGEYIENPLFYRTIMATSMKLTHSGFGKALLIKRLILPLGSVQGLINWQFV